MKKFWVVLIVLALMAAGLLTAGWLFMRSLEGDVAGPTSGVLEWRIAGPYAERRDESPVGLVTRGYRPVMAEITSALGRAARDDDITGLLLVIDAAPLDWAKLEELRDAVTRFGASGKPVAAWLSAGGAAEYLLASAADRVALAPEGALLVAGASAELSFLAGTLDKLGMKADFVHVGRYKSAPESMTRTAPTDPHREMVEAIVEDHYQRLLTTIADARDLTREAVAAEVDRGLHDAGAAVAAGLVDETAYLPDFTATVFSDDRRTDLHDYVLAGGGGRGPRVALIRVVGTIVDGVSSDGWRGSTAGGHTVCERLRDAADDPRVDAIILRVDSPGGSATASDLIWNEVRAARERKPVVASMSGYAASGGYYVACGADSVFAEPGTLTGSIGVFAGKIDRHGFFEKIGVSREYVSRGENALIFGDQAVFTPEQRALLQGHLDAFYERFLARVGEGRGMERDAVHAVAQGRVWTGRQAAGNGLVDGLGGLDRALDAVRALLGVPPDSRLTLQTHERSLGFLDRLLMRLLQDVSADPVLSAELSALAGTGLLRQAELCDGRPLALLPWQLDFR